MKLEVDCEVCGKKLIFGDWQVMRDKTWLSIFIYRCENCDAVYEKIFHGYEKFCKGCKTHRAIFVATNSNHPVRIENRQAA